MLRRVIFLLVLGLGLLTASSAFAAPTPGAASLGDPLFPQVGNGGYDVGHYDLDLTYDPATNALGTGTRATITATATQDLSSFSLDFQRDLAISAVTLEGQPAPFDRRDARRRFSRNPKVTQPAKLFITPAQPLAAGTQFRVEVDYSGIPAPIVDADESLEGWVRACSSPGNCDGSFTVSEPIGAQSWFPCNNYMTDKASFDTSINVPDGYTALGAGELASRVPGPAGTTTWNWTEDDPTATYLTTATVGRFDFGDDESFVDAASGATLPVYTAIDSAGSAKAKADVAHTGRRVPSMINFLSKRYGAYPFDSVGYVADWVPQVGYALENQTKPHFAGDKDGPLVKDRELLHEFAHQWMGDSVSARTWQQIWFNEGWATFSEVLYGAAQGGEQSPREYFRAVISSKAGNFTPAPAALGDPADLFAGFPVYTRPGAMIEGYREIVGNRRFFAFARGLGSDHLHGTITERQFVRAAKRGSGLGPAGVRRLGAYFHQWLHREGKPTLTPRDFR